MKGKEVVIIGAGPGGLTAGMILANQGFKVKIYEKESSIGGRSAALKLGDYVFDTGPTFLMMQYILEEIFQETGRNVYDYLKFTKLDPMYRLQFNDREISPSADREIMTQEIAQAFPGEEKGLEKFFQCEEKRFANLYTCLKMDYTHFTSMLRPSVLKALPYFGINRSLFDVLGDYFVPEKLRLAFTFQAKYLGMSPWECPGGFAIISYIEHRFGIWHVEGGLNRICHAMAKVIEEEGGQIFTHTPVEELLLEGKVAKGVILENGETVKADYVIVNADFAYAMSHLVQEGVLKKYAPKKLAKKDYSCSTFMLYLGLDTVYPLPHHSIIFSSDYRRNVEDIFKRKVLSEETSIYIQNASVTDPTLAPAGHSALYVLAPVANNSGSIHWEEEKDKFRELILRTIEEKTPLKDIRSHIQAERVIAPDEWERDYHVYQGATFNLSHKISQMLYFRPRNRFEELKGVYLVGGGTSPGSGLPTIYESARISSRLIVKETEKNASVHEQKIVAKGIGV